MDGARKAVCNIRGHLAGLTDGGDVSGLGDACGAKCGRNRNWNLVDVVSGHHCSSWASEMTIRPFIGAFSPEKGGSP